MKKTASWKNESARGKAIDAAKNFITATAIDFVVPTNATSYLIRSEFVNLLQEMTKIESSLTIKATKGNDQWKVPETIPSLRSSNNYLI
eukprot:7106633-Ditylum_brightwellii.AAC.1